MQRPSDPDDRRRAAALAGPGTNIANPSSSALPLAAPLPIPEAPISKHVAPLLPRPGLKLPACARGRQAEPLPAVQPSDSSAGLGFSESPADASSLPKGSKVGSRPF